MESYDYNELDAITSADGKLQESFITGLGFARIVFNEGLSVAHYHKNTTEYYLVIAGTGMLRTRKKSAVNIVTSASGRRIIMPQTAEEKMKDIKEVALKEDVVVRIDPEDIHQVRNDEGLIIEAITTPPWEKSDEHVVKEMLF